MFRLQRKKRLGIASLNPEVFDMGSNIYHISEYKYALEKQHNETLQCTVLMNSETLKCLRTSCGDMDSGRGM